MDIARSGDDALELVKEKRYGAVLMDISLGRGISGLDVTKFIREIPGYENTPIIAVTAYAMNGEKEKFLAAGLNDYISKPFKNTDLIAVLRRAFSQKESD